MLRRLKLELSTEGADTFAGLLTARLGRVLEVEGGRTLQVRVILSSEGATSEVDP